MSDPDDFMFPNGEITHTVTRTACLPDTTIDIAVEMWERDAPDPDDFEIDWSTTVDYSGGSPSSGCTTVDPDHGGFCWTLTVNDPLIVDADGDGLPDDWETNGVDLDCNGVLEPGKDLFLQEMGVSPTHKDLLLEFNWFTGFAPSVADLNRVKEMFARAPVDAGGVDNPDGQPGINVIIDAGDLMNDVGVHTIGGIDFGSVVDSPNSAEEIDDFFDSYEDIKRVGFFRQFLMAPLFDEGQPEVEVAGKSIGNDRIIIGGSSAETIAHELGHGLGLLHGGELEGEEIIDYGQNCKPNHISIMNYLYGAYLGGIPFETNGTTSNYYIDFSPSKVPDDQIVISTAAALRCPPGSNGCNRRLPLLPTYHEGLLDDTTPMLIEDVDSGVLLRQLLLYASPYSSSPDAVFEGHLYDPIDWDATPATQGTAYSGNPDIVSALEGAQGCGVDRNSSQTYHHNLDEWSRIIMAAGRGVLGQDLIADPNKFSVDAHRPFEPAFFMPRREKMLKTDLIVVGFLNPTPIAIGEAAQLQIDVANVGMRTASNGYVEVILPEGTVTSVTPERCEEQSSLVYLCSLGYFSAEEIELRPLAAGSNTSFTFDLVFQAIPTGAKRDIVLSVIHEGVDTNPEDNIHIVEVLTLPSFFGFDDQSRPWSQAYSNGSVPLTTTTSNVTAGQRSGVFGCGFNSYETPTFDTMELSFASETLVLDVWVPESVGQGWVGEVQLFAHIPSAAIYDAWISLKSLNTLPRGEWSQLHFAISQQIQSALLGDFPDARLKLSVNVGSCSDPILIDSLRFAGESTVRTVYHPSNSALVASSSVLTFDELADWHLVGGSGGTLALDDTDYIEGTAALALSPGNFSRIESREFSTTELEQVTETISLEVGIPELPPDYYWLGQMNLFIECPSAELWQTFLGYQPLQILFDGEYNRVEYTIPQHVLNVLGGEFNDCKFMIDVSSNSGYTPILLDGGGFVQ